MHLLDQTGSSWAKVVATNGQSPLGAAAAAAARLLLWHWLQPALYFAVFGAYWPELNGWQRGFGGAVAAREALYFLTTAAALHYNPAFLLVDVAATVRDKEAGENYWGHAAPCVCGGYAFLAMYVLAPEKFVALALGLGRGSWSADCCLGGSCLGDLWVLLLVGGALLDLCGVAALVAGLHSLAGLAPALAVGYGVAALGTVWLIGFSMA